MAAKKEHSNSKLVAQNRRARFDYFLTETFEAGLALRGTEVKSLREGKGNIQESYAEPKNGEIWLINAYIPEYQSKMPFGHEERRPRKLLLHKREIAKMSDAVNKKGTTLVPVKVYFNDRGIAKLELAIGEGKRKSDKRDAIKERDWQRDKARILREH
ncbi:MULTISPECIES: SsrA-binding protein SmpB [unclassified Thalassospira]|jgi:SsrA-binding protein|uniref:SsrA-binding protein SmpB n=1 Tax=unclassified Thalassospira TaxID=2648997 RepID=UPI000A1EF77B|nr:SsrA-binding protein SmpB [Thalassospira sp. MCCC 1A01428]OSQ41543.1 SsrA-binding protein [Thalassospira sp. MCCC 1A01428]